jgi:hypothetical protein
MIPIMLEAIINLSQVTRNMPPGRNGKQPTKGCVMRWILRGSRGPDGSLVRLEAVRLGGRWVTSEQALQRFVEALTPKLSEDPSPNPRTAAKRQRASEAAGRELEKLGM